MAETLRKILAAVIGLLIIIALIIAAKWTGDQIRQKFFTPKTPTMVEQTVPAQQTQPLAQNSPTATYSAIPSTGPREDAMVLLVFFALAGVVTLRFAKSPTA
ncbi:MAG: hypothetical protein M1484_00310 [Patescibacteria group bacterium]|nr:hypothetical protein [Patescibacteria group bacterium]MCL5431523.1 hypothetical protein [Patescibacteria group bacterium]